MDLPCQASLSVGFSRQEYWVGFHALLQGIFPTRDQTCVPMSSALVGGFFTTSATYTYIYVYIHIPIHIYILPEISGPVFCTRTPSTNRQEIIWYLLRAWYCARYILRYNGDCYIKPIIKQITVCAISKIASYKTSFIIFPHGWPSFQSSVFITWSFKNTN